MVLRASAAFSSAAKSVLPGSSMKPSDFSGPSGRSLMDCFCLSSNVVQSTKPPVCPIAPSALQLISGFSADVAAPGSPYFTMVPAGNIAYSGEVLSAMFLSLFIRQRMLPVFNAVSDFHG